MELQNLFSFDILIQGMFLLGCFGLGCYILFKDNLENTKDKSINEFSKTIFDFYRGILELLALNKGDGITLRARSIRYIGIIPVFITISFMAGILGYAITDNWMDSNESKHIYLKQLWVTPELVKFDSILVKNQSKDLMYEYGGRRVKDLLRLKSFSDIYNYNKKKDTIVEKEYAIKQGYYFSRHEIMRVPEYANYLRKSELLVEYSQSFALGFFIIIIFSFANLIIMLIRLCYEVFLKKRGIDKIDELKTNDSKNTINQSNEELQESDLQSSQQYNTTMGKPLDKTQNENQDVSDQPAITITSFLIFVFAIMTVGIISLFISPKFGHIDGIVKKIFTIVIVFFGPISVLLCLMPIVSKRKLQFSYFVYALIYFIGIMGYFISSKAWLGNTRMVAYITFGVHRTLHISDDIEEIKLFKNEGLESFGPFFEYNTKNDLDSKNMPSIDSMKKVDMLKVDTTKSK